jgi:hypothetical protein
MRNKEGDGRGMSEPTPEQEERLSRITDQRQRRVLEAAIAKGEDIPEFAWTPIRPMTADRQATIDGVARDLVTRFGSRAPDVIAEIDLSGDDAPEMT